MKQLQKLINRLKQVQVDPISEKKVNVAPTCKRKRGNDKFDGLVEKLIKMSDRNYVKLEEKLLDMEEQRQRETQDFQLKMISMLCGQSPYCPSPYNYTFTNQEDNHQY